MAKNVKIAVTVDGNRINYELENGTLQDMYTVACYALARYILQGMEMGLKAEDIKDRIKDFPAQSIDLAMDLNKEGNNGR